MAQGARPRKRPLATLRYVRRGRERVAGLRAWMRGRGAAAAAVALVLVAVAVGVAAQESGPEVPPETTFKTTTETTCWGCHGDNKWSPPMKDPFVDIQPPATTGAPVETQFNWTVDFVMTWNPKPQVPHLLTADPCLDLHDAPSLRFIGSHPDVHDSQNRFIAPDLSTVNQRQQNLTRVQVDAGVTSLTWTVDPREKGTTAPDLILTVVAPGGNQTALEYDEAGPGEPETHTFTGAELEQLGPGNWTVGAAFDPPSAAEPAPPQLTRVDFTLSVDALYDTASLRTLCNPRPVYVNGGGRVLETWQLKFVQDPGAGESVNVTFGTVGWYLHTPAVLGGDFAGFTNGRNLNLGVEGGRPVIVFESVGPPPRPSPVNGVTVTQVSEILGYASAFLLLSSIISGGMFGQASRRGLNSIFHSAKRRVAYHNFLSYGLTVAALLHMVIFLVPVTPGDCGPAGLCRLSEEFKWHKGLLWWGAPALLAMAGLGVTGALQVPMIRRWSYPTWKWWHYGLTVATIAFTILHMVLDGKNFGLEEPFTQWQEQVPDPLAFLSDETQTA